MTTLTDTQALECEAHGLKDSRSETYHVIETSEVKNMLCGCIYNDNKCMSKNSLINRTVPN